MKTKTHILIIVALFIAAFAFAANPTDPTPQEKTAQLRTQVKQLVQQAADGPKRLAMIQASIEQAKKAALAKLADPTVAAAFTADELAALKALLQ